MQRNTSHVAQNNWQSLRGQMPRGLHCASISRSRSLISFSAFVSAAAAALEGSPPCLFLAKVAAERILRSLTLNARVGSLRRKLQYWHPIRFVLVKSYSIG